jgi:hypothetical protein
MRRGGWDCLNGLLHEILAEAQFQLAKRKAIPVISPQSLSALRKLCSINIQYSHSRNPS